MSGVIWRERERSLALSKKRESRGKDPLSEGTKAFKVIPGWGGGRQCGRHKKHNYQEQSRMIPGKWTGSRLGDHVSQCLRRTTGATLDI